MKVEPLELQYGALKIVVRPLSQLEYLPYAAMFDRFRVFLAGIPEPPKKLKKEEKEQWRYAWFLKTFAQFVQTMNDVEKELMYELVATSIQEWNLKDEKDDKIAEINIQNVKRLPGQVFANIFWYTYWLNHIMEPDLVFFETKQEVSQKQQ